MAAEAFAPAKINLTLHVTGQRADGYHLLDSLVVFAGVGDDVRAERAAGLSLTVAGPMAAGLAGEPDNLVLKAARHLGISDVHLTLTKRLPVASGIGGGSSDAAAAIRALCALQGRALPDPAALAGLGADVPVCLSPVAQRMRGTGERLEPVGGLPRFWLVLANPGLAVATADVFRALERRDGTPMPEPLPRLGDIGRMAGFLRGQRNDLEPAARRVAPVVGEVLAALGGQAECLLARMSGSGATCFGLFAGAAAARTAARAISAAEPGWWVAAAGVPGTA